MKVFSIVLIIVLLAALIAWIVYRKPLSGSKTTTSSMVNERPRPVQSLVESFLKPSILIKSTLTNTASYLGGQPPQFPAFKWPEHKGRPMGFLACIDLSQLPDALDWLPKAGKLLFFYDMEEQPWGFDPSDRGGWFVIHVTGTLETDGPMATVPPNLNPEHLLKSKRIRFVTANLPPTWEDDALSSLNLTDAEENTLMEWRSSLCGEGPLHLMGGYPDPVQTAQMALECQLVSNGLYCGDATGYQDPRAKQLADSAKDWQLLLQMDSDDDLGVMWGDVGSIYFWIRADDAKQGHFDRAWLILQSH